MDLNLPSRFRLRWSTWLGLVGAVAAFSVPIPQAVAQPAELDPRFRAALASGLNVSTLRSLAVQSDGKVLVAGSLISEANLPHPGLVRLNPDGTFDPGFRPAIHVNQVSAMAALRSGKILIVGSLHATNGVVTRTNYARLNADGSLDPEFEAGIRPASMPLGSTFLREVEGGKVVVMGNAFPRADQSRSSVVRLLEDGRLDEAYGRAPIEGGVRAWAPGLGDELYLSGLFVPPFGPSPVSVVRLRGDGSVDASFQTSEVWLSDWAMAPSGDGGVYVHTVVNGVTSGLVELEVIRLRRDGSRDPAFRASVKGRADQVLPDGGVMNPPAIRAMIRQPDGRVVIAGKFTSVNGVARVNLARLEADGRLDESFDPRGGPTSTVDSLSYLVDSLTPTHDGGLYVAGRFDRYANQSRAGLVRLLGDPLPRLRMGRAADGRRQAEWIGPSAVVVEFETSLDLIHWVPWQTLTNQAGVVAAPLPDGDRGFVRGRSR